MNCKYKFNGTIFDSYEELIKNLDNNSIELVLSILFSLDKQQTVYDKIWDIKKEYSFKASQTLIDEDADISVGTNYTTQTFIDSGHFLINGEAPMFRKNNDEYLATMKQLFKDRGLSEEDAEQECVKIKQKEENIAKAAYDLHRIIVSTKDDPQSYRGAALKTAFLDISDLLKPLADDVIKNVRKKLADSKLIKNINLEALLKGLDESIIGHIDYLMVRPDGDVEIFNLKVSKDSSTDWQTIKKEKFKYQLALLKRILEANGVNAKDIRLHLIPVKVDFDENYEKVLKVSAENPIDIDLKGLNYTFAHYDAVASLFIDSNVEIDPVTDEDMETVNNQLNHIFAGGSIDVRSEGIKESVKHWIDKNWNSIAIPATNKKGWNVVFPNEEPIYVEDTRIGNKNETVVNLVLERAETLLSSSAIEKTTYRILKDILESYRQKRDYISSSFGKSHNTIITQLLSKYFEKELNGEYKWELVLGLESLVNSNILLFRHKKTNLTDIISLTPFDVELSTLFKRRNNLLGNYLLDINQERFTLKATYGNIEAIRTMTMVNLILSKLNYLPRLGLLKIISMNYNTFKKGSEYELSLLLPLFDTIVKVVNENNKDLKMNNNFKSNSVKSIDPAHIVVQTWTEAMLEVPVVFKTLEDQISGKTKIDGTVLDGLETVQSIEAKLLKLHIIMDSIKKLGELYGFDPNPENIHRNLDKSNRELYLITKLYLSTLKAINLYNGDISLENESFSEIEEYTSKPQSIDNSNVRVVALMFQKTVNTIADKVLDRYSPIRNIMMLYYKDSGYTSLENTFVGDKARVFTNLYEIINGVKTFRFKNPYDLSNNLKPHERKFLKDILWEMNKVRWEMHGWKWEYAGKDDPKIIKELLQKGYLNVPLERASNATRRSNIQDGFKLFGKRVMKLVTKPKEYFQEFTDNLLSEEERHIRETDFTNLLAYNPFNNSERDINSRSNYITDKGESYFETDVENLMIDFLEKHILSQEYSKMLLRTKGILLDLYLKGETGDNKDNIDHTIKTITLFISVSVYNRSIMNETSQTIDSYLLPIRTALSRCYIALNPVGAMRDIIQGFQENIIRTLTKFQTNINASDVIKGYKDIITEGPLNPMKISIYNLLNLKYRLSNLDVARISEGQKTGRGGILNWENILFSTLRGPDYLNRMVLFSARLHHDGVDKAYYLKDGKLVYDYKLDRRFEAYVNNKTSDPKYNEQRAFYLSLLRAFNTLNGTTLVEGDALPDAYTLLEIEGFKQFADNIYGSYNQSSRQKLEHIVIGRNFTPFITWMNGIVDVYWKKTQLSTSETIWQQAKDDYGNLLYYDDFGNIKTLEEGGNENLKVMENVPIMVLGVFQTLHTLFKELRNNGFTKEGFQKMWETRNSNDVLIRNTNRIPTDLLWLAFITLLFNLVINPAYKEHKKEADGNNLAMNMMLELLYKSSSRSYDTFMGPLAVLDYVGNSTNPAAYKFVNTKIINDSYRFLCGDKSFTELMMGMSALPRSFNDTYTMWVKENEK